MNASDLARLEIAKRAFRATEPSAAEVQAGVRRARLALRRPRERRRWFSKGLVMVVLAVGGLAYAKPQPLGELVSSVITSRNTPRTPGVGKGPAVPEPQRAARAEPRLNAEHVERAEGPRATEGPEGATPLGRTPQHDVPPASAIAAWTAAESADQAPQNAARSLRAGDGSARAEVPAATNATATAVPTAKPNHAGPVLAQHMDHAAEPPPSAAQTNNAVSDWGRVGQALAQGDEGRALSVLAQLSESTDQSTRDKADLGRAQLFLSHGNRDHACDIARSLTRRRVGSSIARQVQVVLKSCKR